MKTVIIGLGNPILTDDSVGIKVSRILKDRLNCNSGIDVKEVYAGGIRLMDEMVGYNRAIIIDAASTGKNKPGTVYSMSLKDLVSTRNIVCAHDTNLATAIEMGKSLGLSLPSDIRIIGIEAADVENFGEELTEDVARAVPAAVEEAMNEIRERKGGSNEDSCILL